MISRNDKNESSKYLVNEDQYNKFKYEILKHIKYSEKHDCIINDAYYINADNEIIDTHNVRDLDKVNITSYREVFVDEAGVRITIDSKINMRAYDGIYNIDPYMFENKYLIQIENKKNVRWLSECISKRLSDLKTYFSYSVVFVNDFFNDYRKGIIYA